MREMDALIAKGCPDGSIVLALEQTKGRGSGDREWKSGAGNVLFSRSIAVLQSEYGQEMEIIAAGAVMEIVRDLLPDRDVTLKYPNDVLVDGDKICGCLVPPSWDANPGYARIVNLGVGVNLKTAPELADGNRATSLAKLGVALDIDDFMLKFESAFADILSYYRQHSDFNAVLGRLGFLDSDGMMTLRPNGSGDAVRGAYGGFHIDDDDGKKAIFLVLRVQAAQMEFDVHSVTMSGSLRRNFAQTTQQGKIDHAKCG